MQLLRSRRRSPDGDIGPVGSPALGVLHEDGGQEGSDDRASRNPASGEFWRRGAVRHLVYAEEPYCSWSPGETP